MSRLVTLCCATLAALWIGLGLGGSAHALSTGRPTSITQTDTTSFSAPYTTNGRTRTWSYTWSAAGQLLTATDPNSHTTTYTYNSDGYLATVTDALSHVMTTTSWDWRGAPTSVTDLNGMVTTFTYDIHGRVLTSTVNPGASQSLYQFAYTAMGDVSQVTLPGGGYLQYTYNDARRVTLITNDRGETQAFTYDADGNQLSQTTKDGSSTITQQRSAAFDELGRLIQSIGASGATTQATSFAYDKLGNLTSTTDPLSHTRQTAFDALNRAITTTDPLSNTVQYAYDGQDNLTTHTDGRSLATVRTVDGFGRLIQEVSPDRGTRSYWYDTVGNLTKLVDGDSEETDFTYDALNRLASKTFPGDTAETVTYTYDQTTGGNAGIGHLTNVAEQSGSTSLTYDAQGHLVGDAKVIQGHSYAVGYAYDANGKVIQIIYPSGRIVLIARNTDGQITGVTTKQTSSASAVSVATSVTYAPFGPLTGLTYGNGLVLTRTYDQNYWLTETKVNAGSTTPLDLGFQWYNDGRMGEVDDNASTGRTTYISYTDAGQLAYTNGPWGEQSYAYDAAYNRVGLYTTAGGVSTTNNEITWGTSNRLANIQDASSTIKRSFSWRVGGDLYSDSTVGGDSYQYNYNALKRVVQVLKNGSEAGTYGYDYQGRRVWRSVDATSANTQYVFDPAGHLLAEHNGSTGAVQKEYIWLGDLPVAVIDWTTGSPYTYYIHAGQMDEPLVLTNASQAKVWDVWQDPWGNAGTFSSPSEPIDLRLPGQWLQIEANGLHQNWHRDYDPSTGRYVQADPLGIAAGQNLYAYVGDDPLNGRDPAGLFDFDHDVWLPIWKVANAAHTFIAGAGDSVSFGGAAWLRHKLFPCYSGPDTGSYLYHNGEFAGVLLQLWATAGISSGAVAAESGAVDAADAAAVDLKRPYIRQSVRQDVEAAAPRTPDGRPIDPNTGQPIDGTPDFGHKPGNEFWREKQAAESEGLTQQQFNDRMNDPNKYQLEDPSSNRSHRYEQPR